MSSDEILKILDKFISNVCIEGDCGYDLKKLIFDIMAGICTYDEAINEWLSLGHYLL